MDPGRLALVALTLSFSCDLGVYDPEAGGDGDGDVSGRYHPVGFAAANVHGPELNLGAQDCRSCHGGDLAGDIAAPSCDTCHTPETPQVWRADCTFCHGGTDSVTGAPPRDLDGSTTGITFPAHTAHMSTAMMAAIDCTDCHVKPGDMLAENHVFDDTKGVAEMVFTAGRSPEATFADGTCSNMYCHGDGRQNGSETIAAAAMSCSGCHGTPPGSGEHGEHRDDPCSDCHNSVTKDDVTIADPALHIDGARQVVIDNPGGLTVTVVGGEIRCSGQCHNQGRDHENDRW